MAIPSSALKAAFLLPLNLLGLAGAGVAALATQEPKVLLATAGAEALFLAVASSLQRWRDRRRPRSGAGPEAELDGLAPSQREHYFVLRDLQAQIFANYQKLPGGGVLVADSEPRVEALLGAFLRLLTTLNSYRTYLNAADRRTLERELETLRVDAGAEPNPRLREVKQRRVEILEKRVQRFSQAEESREVVSHQLAGIEDLLRLTHEQSIALRDPESASRQLEALSSEVQSTERTVRELERFLDPGGEPAGVLGVPLGAKRD